MPRPAAALLLIGLLAGTVSAAPTRPKDRPASAVDTARDARLAARVRLRSEAIPVRRVLRALADETGVRLDVAGAAGDERLVAFVPEGSLAEVMQAVADLYRLAWTRGGSPERPSYQLLKTPAMAREEQERRQQAMQQLLAGLAAKLREPPRPAAEERPDPLAAVYPLILPLITARSQALMREGFIYIPVASLPVEQRAPLVRALQPDIDRRHAFFRALVQAGREQRKARGEPEPDFVISGEHSGPPAAETSTLTVEVSVQDELTARLGLKTGAGQEYGWFGVNADGLQEAGQKLYEDRKPHLPIAADEAPERTPGAEADRLARVVEVPAAKPPRPGDWIGALGRLSDAAGVALYADCYPNYLDGWHPRSDFAVFGKLSVAQALNRLCYPIANRGDEKLAVNSFWWRRCDAALVRSRRWLWESAAVLPTELLDRLTISLRATGRLDPRDLPGIAALTALQAQSIGFLDGSRDVWQRAVQIPAGLSLEARQLLLTEGLTWEKLPPADRERLTQLLPLPPGGSHSRYAARIKTSIHPSPAQGSTVASLNFEAAGELGTEGSVIHLPLPGVGAGPGLPPQGLQVELLPREGS
jgi:hypothetical protein